MIRITGKYRDILMCRGNIIKETGWQPNSISDDCGKLLAGLVKMDFSADVGIQYMAVGGGSGRGRGIEEVFKSNVTALFKDKTWNTEFDVLSDSSAWVWVKKIDELIFLDEDDDRIEAPEGTVTNRLKITIRFPEHEPTNATWTFKEFALLGVDKTVTEEGHEIFNTAKLFFINYVDHGPLTKNNEMTFTRTVQLTFP